MRIAYVSSDFGVPILGSKGCSVHVREVTRALRGLGHEVRIFSPSPGADPEAAARAGIHGLPLAGLARAAARFMGEDDLGISSHLIQEFRRLLYSEQLEARLAPAFHDWRPDVIYERYALFGYAGVELARKCDIPLLLEVNAPLAQEGAKRRGWVLANAAASMEAEILRRADAVLAVSEAVAGHARSLGVGPERVHVNPNGVDPARFHPGTRGDAVRRELGLSDGPVVGFLGSMRPWHDLDTVREALELVRADGLPVRFLAVGPGAREAGLDRDGADWVVCPGAVAHERVPEFVAAMDLGIVPFGGDEKYFSPLKLYEYMAMERPIVAADMGQVRDLIEPGRTGFLYEPGNAADLAARIRGVLGRPDRGRSLGAASRRLVLEEHTWEARARRIGELAGSARSARAAA